MEDARRKVLRRVGRTLTRTLWRADYPLPLQRAWMEVITSARAPAWGSSFRAVEMGVVPAERVERRGGPADATLLYLHGGGYCLGSPRTHRGITSRLARLAGATVFAPHYRRAPEHPCPAMQDDALACYRWLLEQGHPPGRIAFCGDSAGGGLAIATAQAARDAGLPLPRALALISPWVDLSLGGPSVESQADRDPLQSVPMLRQFAAWCRGSLSLTDPRCSPLFGDLAGLPPMLLHVGTDEILLSDAQRLAAAAGAAGTPVRLVVFDGLWHVFHAFAGALPAAEAALGELAAFARSGSLAPA